MSTTAEIIASHLPGVDVDDLQRRFTSVEIRDPQTFAVEIEQYVQDALRVFIQSVPSNTFTQQIDSISSTETINIEDKTVVPPFADDVLARAASLRAPTRWTPSDADLRRGRAAMMRTFSDPHLVTVQHYAELVGKSPGQVHKDIRARRLLVLSIGPRKKKLPEWQLERRKQELVRTVLQAAPSVDSWTIYNALTERLDELNGRSPVVAAEKQRVESVAKAVLNVLGITG